MRVGILITNGQESHPPGMWAQETAAQLVAPIEVDKSSPRASDLQLAKDELELAFRKALIPHHAKVQDDEWDNRLAKEGDARLSQPLDPSAFLDQAVADTLAAAKSAIPELAAHYEKPEVQQFVRSTLASHFATVMEIERSWHADLNADPHVGKAYQAAKRDHGGAQAHHMLRHYLPGGELHGQVNADIRNLLAGGATPAAPSA